jgi:MYXO-CTERM domain-containing protein
MRATRSSAGWLASWLLMAAALTASDSAAWVPVPVADDPLVRMPGTQPADQVTLQPAGSCLGGCHDAYDENIEPGFNWMGSMMAQAMRDPIFWAAVTVAAQDSIWAVGTPNAADLCLRCHTPAGWLGGRSDPTNGSAFTGSDFEGITCDFCHRMTDPFFEDTYAGLREGNDWLGYWDETGMSATPAQAAADATVAIDRIESATLALFNGNLAYTNSQPTLPSWTENGGGQYFVSPSGERRGPFADAVAIHGTRYSRYHKSRNFCGTCHDVSNAVLANLPFAGTPPGDGNTVLPSEEQPAHSYGHIERTFSEFMLSDYGRDGGAVGIGPFSPAEMGTSRPGSAIATCQDCHMADRAGRACEQTTSVDRPSESVEHPQSAQPFHDLTGANMWVPYLLASSIPGSPNYDAANEALLAQGPNLLTLDLTQGIPMEPAALLAGIERALTNLQNAAAITELSYDSSSGAVSFRIQNQTGHKLISGYPEGRRMFVNVRVYQGIDVVHEVNPYDEQAATLRGLDLNESPSSPALAPAEVHVDELVYEVRSSSSLTGENHTFHIALATAREKDNRIPPLGFRIGEAAARLIDPVWNGVPAPDYFTAEEYAGGYDAITLDVPVGADAVEVRLFYQTTSREYVEFLRDEIDGTASTLSSPTPSGETNAYVAQSDPFFAKLAAWGATIWQLWDLNRDVPGAAPVLMAQALVGEMCSTVPDGQACDDADPCTRLDKCAAGVCVGTAKSCDAEECQVPACEPSSGDCLQTPAPDGTPCAAGVCGGGVCGPVPPPEEDDGCGCRIVAPGTTPPWLALLLAGLAVALRRRRSRP